MSEKLNRTHLIFVCHALHGFVGHEYTYTKLIVDNLPDNYSYEVWARVDVKPEIAAGLNLKRIFSRLNYHQEEPFLKKAWSLLLREVSWFLEFRKALFGYSRRAGGDVKTVFLLHTISLYNVWSWVFHWRTLSKLGHSAAIVLRYSSVLLPNVLRRPYYFVVSKFPNHPRLRLLTDSEDLRDDYFAHSAKKLDVLPVPVDCPPAHTLNSISRGVDGEIRVTYLGAARNDKGFKELPQIVKSVLSLPQAPPVRFVIQASVSATGHLEAECARALQELKELQKEFPDLIVLIERPLPESEYAKLLAESGLILLPYLGASYKLQTSGILVEAAAYGIPCVVPQGTWMDRELSRTGGGLTYDQADPNGASQTVIELLRNYPEFLHRAEHGRASIEKRHGVNKFTRELFSVIDQLAI